MKPRERTVVYTLLTAVLMLNGIVFLNQTSTPAHADSTRGIDKLGPTDAVILSGDENIEISNRDARIGWSDSTHHRLYSTGFVHLGRILPKLMDSEIYAEERQELVDELNARDQEFRERGQELQEQYGDVQQGDENFQEAAQAAQQFQQEYNAFREEASTRMSELDSRQLEQAYRDLTAAVDVVAGELDIDLVYRFIPPGDAFDAGNVQQAMTEIRMRTVVKLPDGLEITDDVLEELALPLD